MRGLPVVDRLSLGDTTDTVGTELSADARGVGDVALDHLALLAARLLGAPVAVVSVVDGAELTMPTRFGLPVGWVSEHGARQLCRSAATSERPLVLTSTRAVRRAGGDAGLVDPGIGACLGAPLLRSSGISGGALCVIDHRRRAWRPSQVDALVGLAGMVAALLDLRALVEEGARSHKVEQPTAAAVSSIAHDLQQPLTVIKGQTQLLRRAMRDHLVLGGVDLAAGLAVISAAADRMTVQIKDLVDLSTARLGQPIGAPGQPVDLVELAREAVWDHQRGAGSTAIALASGEATLPAFVDASRFRRVLDNVLGNAIKYSPGGEAVLVTVERQGAAGAAWAVLQVRDHGIGIPAADLPHVTERFYRGGNVAGIVAGSGIGLAAVRDIVEDYGGSLTLESTRGRGTTVTLRLPLEASADALGLPGATDPRR
jgi:signal transduction histidine kinase